MRKQLFFVLVFFIATFTQTEAANPHFGLSGQYGGQILYQGRRMPAVLSLVQERSRIRGIINTELAIRDRDGTMRKGTSIYLMGAVNRNSAVLSFGSHECPWYARICEEGNRRISMQITANFEAYEEGNDYVLYRVEITGTSDGPFALAQFQMDITYAYDVNPQNPYYGIWKMDGYQSELIYASVPGARFLDLTIFRHDSQDYRNIFLGTVNEEFGTSYFPANHVVRLYESNPQERRVILLQTTRIPYRYELNLSQGWAFGTIRFTDDKMKDKNNIDFEALVWGYHTMDGIGITGLKDNNRVDSKLRPVGRSRSSN